MADSSTVTIRLSNHAKEQLAELADRGGSACLNRFFGG
jgi:hypothetical protein